MLLVACVLAGSVLAGRIAGGRLRNLGQLEPAAMWLVFLAVGLQFALGALAVLGGPARAWSGPLLLGSHLALLGFVVANRSLPGMALVVVGFGLNAVVIAANGAMPVDPEALLAVGGADEIVPGKHRLLEAGDRLRWLADIIPIPPLRTVVSVGDVVLAAGIAVLVLHLMRREPPRPGSRVRPAPRPLWRR